MIESMETNENELQTHTIQARFVSDAGEEAGPPIDLPIGVDVEQLGLICNALLKNVSIYLFRDSKASFNIIFIPGRSNALSFLRERR